MKRLGEKLSSVHFTLTAGDSSQVGVILRLERRNPLLSLRLSLSLTRLAMLERRLLKGGIQRGTGLLDRGTRLKLAYQSQPPIAGTLHPRSITVDLRFPRERNGNLQRRADVHGAFKSRRRNTRYREGHIIKIDLFAYHVPIATKTLLPVTMAEHRHGISPSVVVSFGDYSTEEGGNSQDFIVISRHGLGLCDIGQTICIHVQSERAKRDDVRTCSPLLA